VPSSSLLSEDGNLLPSNKEDVKQQNNKWNWEGEEDEPGNQRFLLIQIFIAQFKIFQIVNATGTDSLTKQKLNVWGVIGCVMGGKKILHVTFFIRSFLPHFCHRNFT